MKKTWVKTGEFTDVKNTPVQQWIIFNTWAVERKILCMSLKEQKNYKNSFIQVSRKNVQHNFHCEQKLCDQRVCPQVSGNIKPTCCDPVEPARRSKAVQTLGCDIWHQLLDVWHKKKIMTNLSWQTNL